MMKALLSCLLLSLAASTTLATNFQTPWTSTTIDDTRGGFSTKYTLIATNPTSPSGTEAIVSAGVRVVIDFPAGTDVTGLGQGTSLFTSSFNGQNLLFANVDVSVPAQVSFDAPVGVAEGEGITVILQSIANPVTIGTYTQLIMNLPNNSGGNNTFDMANYTVTCGIFAGVFGCSDTIPAGQTILLTDGSSITADTWDWRFPGGNPSFFTGENPPPIQYANAGDYAVQQIVTNNGGVCRDTILIPDCVHVLPPATGPGTVHRFSKISETEGNFMGGLENMDRWGWGVAGIGDLNGDGVEDLATGALNDDDGTFNAGAVYILFMKKNGQVGSHQKISETQGGFGVDLDANDGFGGALANIGDLDDDGVTDLAVGTYGDDDNCQTFSNCGTGAVYILFMNADGTVRAQQKISSLAGGLIPNPLSDFDNFGHDVAALGDLNGDGVEDIAVGSRGDDDGGGNKGALYILFMNSNGTVNSYQKISETSGGFGGSLILDGRFGFSVENVGDLNDDGIIDLAVGAPNVSNTSVNGAVWILFMNANGTVQSEQEITENVGGFTGDLSYIDFFSTAILGLPDLDCNGVEDMAVGAYNDLDGSGSTVEGKGAIWVMFMKKDGTVKDHQKISATEGGFNGSLLEKNDAFGFSLAFWREKGQKKRPVILAGAPGDDDGTGIELGAYWVLTLNKRIKKFAPATAVGLRKETPDTYAFSLYPNPARDHVILSIPAESSAIRSLGLLDLSGKVLRLFQPAEKALRHKILVSGLSRGLYLLRWVRADGRVQTHKLLIE